MQTKSYRKKRWLIWILSFLYWIHEGIVTTTPLRSMNLLQPDFDVEELMDNTIQNEEELQNREFRDRINTHKSRTNSLHAPTNRGNVKTNKVAKIVDDSEDEYYLQRPMESVETVVEVIEPSKRPVSRDLISKGTNSPTDAASKEVQNSTDYDEELQKLVEEARITKAKIDKLTAELGEESDGDSETKSTLIARNNITSYSKVIVKQPSNKQSNSLTEKLTEQINIEREVRRQLLSHLVKVQVEDQAREEALEEILRHHPLRTEELQRWNITRRALKAIMKARINLLDPSDRMKIANQIGEYNDVLSKRNRIM